jgi:hypothetical protein
MVTLVAGNKKGNGKSGYGQWLRQRGWRTFNGGKDGDGTKDTAPHIKIGERGMMVAIGHGLFVYYVCLGCVCGETTKIRKREKLSMIPRALRKPPT